MTKKTLGLEPQLYNYLLSVSLREPEILQQLRQETANLTGAIMQITPDQGQFMQLLVKLMEAKNAIEVGVYTGYSSLAVALALPKNGKLIACDISKEYTEVARRYWEKARVADKIDLRIAPALDTLQGLLAAGKQASFDFMFIDADKRNYPNYYELGLELLRPGGLIVVDNVLWSGRVVDPTDTDKRTVAIREFNQKLHTDERVDISLVPLADGLTLARKR